MASVALWAAALLRRGRGKRRSYSQCFQTFEPAQCACYGKCGKTWNAAFVFLCHASNETSKRSIALRCCSVWRRPVQTRRIKQLEREILIHRLVTIAKARHAYYDIFLNFQLLRFFTPKENAFYICSEYCTLNPILYEYLRSSPAIVARILSHVCLLGWCLLF